MYYVLALIVHSLDLHSHFLRTLEEVCEKAGEWRLRMSYRLLCTITY